MWEKLTAKICDVIACFFLKGTHSSLQGALGLWTDLEVLVNCSDQTLFIRTFHIHWNSGTYWAFYLDWYWEPPSILACQKILITIVPLLSVKIPAFSLPWQLSVTIWLHSWSHDPHGTHFIGIISHIKCVLW